MKRVIRSISWRMIAEGTCYGFLCMLVAEERVLNMLMPASWVFFLVYLLCSVKQCLPKAEASLVRIASRSRAVAWFLIVAATLIPSMAD